MAPSNVIMDMTVIFFIALSAILFLYEHGEYKQITVRNGKGLKDRITMLPESITAAMKNHIRKRKNLHQQDLQKGHGKTILPKALARKYPGAAS